ncbi:MAG: aminomethyl-transferring glycine dehydrogenase subunit GcvPB [Deltaproteobacteria bacterium]|nr:aminomethyl-transferring glycine dehydrogenase subunit GcvPB [Deltaproteobacteria bacterium]
MKPPGTQGLVLEEPLIFERGSPGRRGYALPELDAPEAKSPDGIEGHLVRGELEGFPEVSEFDVVRHYTRLAQYNYCIDAGLFPLGSCTMKYNPKLHESLVRHPGFSRLHPLMPEAFAQGALRILWELTEDLRKCVGMHACALNPAAGAHGEFTGVLMIRAYHLDRGGRRRKIIVPATAHGTNPATAAMCGFEVVPLEAKASRLTVDEVRAVVDDETAAIMLTNPSTLGLFENQIADIGDLIHSQGGLLYCDGANLNAIVGQASMGKMGVDVSQFNLHKTFSTPHGGGGPGAGAVVVSERLEPYLPSPCIVKNGDRYAFSHDRPKSIGRIRSFFSNFGINLRAWAYIKTMGNSGLKEMSGAAVLNANYLRVQLKDSFRLAFDEPCMHEAVFSDELQRPHGVTTLDIAKRMIDKGYHPPTVFFPLVVRNALMIEPTESESKETLDQFVAAMREIAAEAKDNPELLRTAPHGAFRRRLDETRAARQPVLRWAPKS